MTTIWVCSDHHFGHENILKFVDGHDEPLRVFADVEEMNWKMVDAHNSVVKPRDHVYMLGDVAMKQQEIAWVKRLNGHKRLVRGNHDIYQTKTYIQNGFEEIYGVRVLNNMVLAHIPIHPESINKRWLGNVHGHLHRGRVRKEVLVDTGIGEMPELVIDPRYLNVSMEMIDYTPITLEECEKRLKEQQT